MTWDAPPPGLLHFQGIPIDLYFPVLLEGGHSNAWRILPTYQSTNTPNKALKPTSRTSLKTPMENRIFLGATISPTKINSSKGDASTMGKKSPVVYPQSGAPPTKTALFCWYLCVNSWLNPQIYQIWVRGYMFGVTTQFLCFNSHLQNWGSTRPVHLRS